MADFAKMYRELFNAQTDAIRDIEATAASLKRAQVYTEKMYIEADEVPLNLIPSEPKNDDDND